MKIPARFSLFGHTYRVSLVKEVDDEGSSGSVSYVPRLVEIKAGLGRTDREEIFFHELTHAILHETGERDLRDNEVFVTKFAQLLHQAMTTGGGKAE